MSVLPVIQQYALIVDSDPQQLVRSVTKMIEDGFHPVGGVAMVREGAKNGGAIPAVTQYSQSMVKMRGRPGSELLVNGGRS